MPNKTKTSVTKDDIDQLMAEAEVTSRTTYDKCTVVCVKLKSGFILTASSACIDPKNYNHDLGKSICLDEIRSRLWELEGYALNKRLHEEGTI